MSNLGFSNADLTFQYYATSPGVPINPHVIHVDPTVPSVDYTYVDDQISLFNIDVGETGLTITFLSPRDFSGVPYTAIELVDTEANLLALQSVVKGSSTVAGFTFTFDADHIRIELQGTNIQANQTIHLDATFADATPPVAFDGSADVNEDEILTGSVPTATGQGTMRYGLDSSDDPNLVFQSDGSYSLDPIGSYEYLGAGETTAVTFAYHAIGPDGARSDTKTVTLTVHGENDAPVVDTTPISLRSGLVSLTGETVSAFLTGVTDADIHDPQGIAITATSGTGTWQYSLDAGASWKPLSAADSAAVLLAATDYIRFSSTDETVARLTYHAWDQSSGTHGVAVDLTGSGATGETTAFSSAAGTASLALGITNHAPVANPDTGTAGENQPASFDVLKNDTDPDAQDTQALIGIGSVSVTSANGAVQGIDAAGAISIVGNQIHFAPGTLFDALAAGDAATVVINYTMEDGWQAQSSSTLTLNVTGENDVAAIGGTASGGCFEDFAVVGGKLGASGTLTIADVDWGEAAFAAHQSIAGTYGTFSLDAAGNWTYAVDNSLAGIQSLGAGALTTDSFVAFSQDGSASHTVTVTIHGVNDAPVLSGGTAVFDPTVTTAAGEQVSAFLTGISDVDNGAVQGIAITSTAGGGTWQYSLNGSGWTDLAASDGTARLLAATDFIRFVAQPGATTASIDYHAWDQTSGAAGASVDLTGVAATGGTTAFSSGSASRTIGLNGVNNAPTAQPDAFSVSEKQTADLDVLANDTDIDSGDALTVKTIDSVNIASSPVALGSNLAAAFAIVAGQIHFDPGSLFQTLAAGDAATVVVGYSIEDSHHASTASTMTLTVIGENDAPVITSKGGASAASYSVVENSTAVGTITASDVDVGDAVHFAIAGGPDAGFFSIDPNSGVLAFRSAPDFEAAADTDHNNVYRVVVQASDGQASDSQTVDVAVGNIGGVRIVGGKLNDTVSAVHSVHGQATPTGEEDVIIGANGKDKLSGLGGNDLLSGGRGDDILNAGAGNDVLIGGWGNNRLIGGPGHDTFVFDSELSNAMGRAYNFSTITDFSPTEDTIRLSHAFFKGIHPGVLSAAAFYAGTGPHDSSDRIIYDPKNGALLYDRDGSNFMNAVEFGKLAPHLHVTHFDFLIA